MRPRLAALAATVVLAASAAAAMPATGALAAPAQRALQVRNVPVCPGARSADAAQCDAVLHEYVDKNGRPVNTNAISPSGYGPSDLQSAYNLAASEGGGAGRTVAIVDAYHDPYAAGDVATYRSYYKLPPLNTCTVSSSGVSGTSPCFAQVNQNGGTNSYPSSSGSWSQEISLDLDMVSAICPNCNILLVEASSASFSNLGTAVNTAAQLGADAISNSYGGSDSSDNSYGSYYDHPGVAVTASSGDGGYGVEYPASSDYTVGVGGTSLNGSSSGWTETAWSGAGSGCSAYQTQPSYQRSITALANACSKRAVADVSADADPNTGVAVYDSFSYQGSSGWLVFGGTSVASPIIASIFTLAGAVGPNSGLDVPAVPYGDTSALHDVTSGSNGSCGGSILCTAAVGWDGPTGLGTPNGTADFGGSGSTTGGGTTSVPQAPTGLTATAGDSQVTLAWTGSTGATSYNVYRSTDGGTIYAQLQPGITSTTYLDSSVSNGTTYTYYVTAVNSAGESPPSQPASATPTSPPSGSTTMSATLTAGSTVSKGRNYQTPLTVTVDDGSGSALSGASVGLTIYSGSTCSGSSVASGSGSTSNGIVTFTFNTKSTGPYCASATVTDTGYSSATAGPTTFTVPVP